jgi:hypothetical protein
MVYFNLKETLLISEEIMTKDENSSKKGVTETVSIPGESLADSHLKPKTKNNELKLPALETWNLLVSQTPERVNAAIGKAVNSCILQETPTDKATEIFRNSKEQLKETLTSAFEQEIDSHVEANRKLGTHFKPETVELLKSNSAKFIDHIIDNSKAFSDEKLNIDGAKLALMKDVNDFHKKIEIRDKETGWRKAAEFCKICGFDRLANACNTEHLKNIAKGYSKGISKAGQDLQTNESKNTLKRQSKSATQNSI